MFQFPSTVSMIHLLALALITSCGSGAESDSKTTAKSSSRPTPIWTLNEELSAPESVYFDPVTKQLFISSVAGQPGDKDGLGWISTVTLDRQGKPKASKLVDGLNAPKGLRAASGFLWVTDIDSVVKVDIKRKKIVKTLPVPGAQFLNDLAIGPDGTVYVSDTIGSKIFAINGDKVTEFLSGEDLESPNGLLVDNGKLVVASWGFITDPTTFGARTPGNLYTLDLTTKVKSRITASPLGNLDGLERAPNGDYLVSDWVAGKVYRVTPAGESHLLLEDIKNAADIGLNGQTLYIPSMGTNSVSAYSL